MSKELECLDRIDKRNYLTEREHKEFLGVVEKALTEYEAIKNANPSEALECLDGIEYVADVLKVNHKIGSRDIANQEIKEMAARLYYRIPTIKQVLLKAQVQEKEKLLFKNIHNTKVKTPLVSIFEGLSKDERFKFTEHIYYHWEEMKEELEDKISSLQKELEQALIQKSKKEQAWDIVVRKNVDMLLIKKYDNVSDYNSAVWLSCREKLTEEEFDTLKEGLK